MIMQKQQIAVSLLLTFLFRLIILSNGQPEMLTTASLRENLSGKNVPEPHQHQKLLKNTFLMSKNRRTESTAAATTSGASPYIVGGQAAAPNEYPYLVRSASIFTPSSLFCTGTLIHVDMILTAAHCQGTFVDGVWVGASSWRSSANNHPFASFSPPTHQEAQYRQIDGQFRHAGFNQNIGILQDDIMLLRLDWPVVNIPLVTLNFNATIPSANDHVTAVGFGSISEPVDDKIWDSSGNSMLQKTDQMQYWDRTSCQQILKKAANVMPGEGIMCASADNQSVCHGDSGGALFWEQQGNDDTNTLLQVGITSFGLGCSSNPIPNGFTRISHYSAWITETVCKYSRHPLADCPPPELYPPFGKVLVNITFQFDADVGETTWAIREQSSGKIIEVGPTDNPRPNSFWWSIVFLKPSSSYRLELYDSYGDGIDDGWYEIWAELQPSVQTLVAPRQMGDFRSMQLTEFEIPVVDTGLFGAGEPITTEAPSSVPTVMATDVPTQMPSASSIGSPYPAASSLTTAHNVDASAFSRNKRLVFLFMLASLAIQEIW